MMTRDLLSKEHREIDALACELLDIVAQAVAPDEGLASLRWRLNHVLMVHLVKEDQLLYPALRKSSNPEVAAIATRFSTEMGGIANQFITHMQRWNGTAIKADWSGFCADTRALLLALRDRVRREERDLYPRLTESLQVVTRGTAAA